MHYIGAVSSQRILRVLIAAAGAVLVTGAGFASLILGVHDPALRRAPSSRSLFRWFLSASFSTGCR